MDHLLTIITFLPLVGAVLCFLAPKEASKALALAVSGITFLVSLPLWTTYDPAAKGPIPGWETLQLVEGPYPWIEDLGIGYHVGVDGIAVLLILLTTFLTPIVIFSSQSSIKDRVNQYLGFMLMLETGMIGAFVALDTFLFYVFWELMLIPMYFIIGIWGGKDRIYATVKFFIYTMAGSLLMLVAILALYSYHHAETGIWTSNLVELYGTHLPWGVQVLCFAAFALAFAVKVPMFPVHTWLPDAHVQAPTGGSVILAGVLLKLGTFGFLRYTLPLFPQATLTYGPYLVTLAVIGIIYGALVAMVQDDIKKLVAYSSVSHMGVVMLGLLALNPQGVSGAVYQMLNHGLSTGALFLLVGVLYERRHTRVIAEYGGLAKVVPLFSFVFMVVTFSSIGLPGLNGFVGELLCLLGAFDRHPTATVFATTGVIFGAVYMLWAYQRMVFGPLTIQENKELTDLNWQEKLYLAPILVLIVVMGVYPKPVLEIMGPSVERVLAAVEAPSNVAENTPATGSQE